MATARQLWPHGRILDSSWDNQSTLTNNRVTIRGDFDHDKKTFMPLFISAHNRTRASTVRVGLVTSLEPMVRTEVQGDPSSISTRCYRHTPCHAKGEITMVIKYGLEDLWQKDGRIVFVATLTPSDNDAKFAFWKRPVLYVTKEEKATLKASQQEIAI